MFKGDSPGDTLAPNQDPALCKGNHWRSKCPHLQMEGKVPPSYGLMGPSLLSTFHFLASVLRSHNGRKKKVIFLLDSGAHFSVLPFSPGPGPMTKVIIQANLASA
jgi:hypothetical protein